MAGVSTSEISPTLRSRKRCLASFGNFLLPYAALLGVILATLALPPMEKPVNLPAFT